MSKLFDLTIRTPEKLTFKGKAKYISLMTDGGVLKILAKHASLTGAIGYSPLVFEDENETLENLVVKNGLLIINNKENTVNLIVADSQKKSELSPTSAKEYLEYIKDQLSKGKDLSDFKIKFYEEEKYVLEKQLKERS
jgi:F0F1-type ATP synthase epsilon subunit